MKKLSKLLMGLCAMLASMTVVAGCGILPGASSSTDESTESSTSLDSNSTSSTEEAGVKKPTLKLEDGELSWTAQKNVSYEFSTDGTTWTEVDGNKIDLLTKVAVGMTKVSVRGVKGEETGEAAELAITVAQLAAPTVEEVEGVITFSGENATAYEVSVDGGIWKANSGSTYAKPTEAGAYSIKVRSAAYEKDGEFYLASEASAAYEFEVQPAAVTLSVNDGVISWTEKAGAKYEVKFGEGSWMEVEGGEIVCTGFSSSTTVHVRVIENGVASEAVSQAITVAQLGAVSDVTLDKATYTYSWTAVENANEYEVTINGYETERTTSTSWTPAAHGDYTITVKALGYMEGASIYRAGEASDESEALSVWDAPLISQGESLHDIAWTTETEFDTVKLYVDGVEQSYDISDASELDVVEAGVITKTGKYTVQIVATKGAYTWSSNEYALTTCEIDAGYIYTFENGLVAKNGTATQKAGWTVSEEMAYNSRYSLAWNSLNTEDYGIQLDDNGSDDVNDLDFSKVYKISYMMYIPETTVLMDAGATEIQSVAPASLPWFNNYNNGGNPIRGNCLNTANVEKGVWTKVEMYAAGMSSSRLSFTAYSLRGTQGPIYFDDFKVEAVGNDVVVPEGTTYTTEYNGYSAATGEWNPQYAKHLLDLSQYAGKIVAITMNVKGNVDADNTATWFGFSTNKVSGADTWNGVTAPIPKSALLASNEDWTQVTVYNVTVPTDGQMYIAASNGKSGTMIEPYAIFIKDIVSVETGAAWGESKTGWFAESGVRNEANGGTLALVRPNDTSIAHGSKVRFTMKVKGTAAATTADPNLKASLYTNGWGTNNGNFGFVTDISGNLDAALRQSDAWVEVTIETIVLTGGSVFFGAAWAYEGCNGTHTKYENGNWTQTCPMGATHKNAALNAGGYQIWIKDAVCLGVVPDAPAAPTLSVNNAVISWDATEGYKYEAKVGNGEWQALVNNSIDCRSVEETTTVQVRAINEAWNLTGAAASATINVSTLAAPTVTVSGTSFVWNEVAGASAYQYKVNDGDWTDTTATSWTTEEVGTYTIQVRAIGSISGSNIYLNSADSAVSASLVIAPGAIAGLKVENGVLSWTAAENTSYKYKVGDAAEYTAVEAGVSSVDLTSLVSVGDTKVYVIATVDDIDGEANEVEISVVQLVAPRATVSGETLVWTLDENVNTYDVRVNEGEWAASEALVYAPTEGAYGAYTVEIRVNAYASGTAFYLGATSEVSETLNYYPAPAVSASGNSIAITEEVTYDNVYLYVNGEKVDDVDLAGVESYNLVAERVVTTTGIYKVKLEGVIGGVSFFSEEINYSTTEIDEGYIYTFESGEVKMNSGKEDFSVVTEENGVIPQGGSRMLKYTPNAAVSSIQLDRNMKDVNVINFKEIYRLSYYIYIPETTILKNSAGAEIMNLDGTNVDTNAATRTTAPFFLFSNADGNNQQMHINFSINKGSWQKVEMYASGNLDVRFQIALGALHLAEGPVYFDNFYAEAVATPVAAPEGTTVTAQYSAQSASKAATAPKDQIFSLNLGTEYAGKNVALKMNVKGNVAEDNTATYFGFARFNSANVHNGYTASYDEGCISKSALLATNTDWTEVTVTDVMVCEDGIARLGISSGKWTAEGVWIVPYAIYIKDYQVVSQANIQLRTAAEKAGDRKWGVWFLPVPVDAEIDTYVKVDFDIRVHLDVAGSTLAYGGSVSTIEQLNLGDNTPLKARTLLQKTDVTGGWQHVTGYAKVVNYETVTFVGLPAGAFTMPTDSNYILLYWVNIYTGGSICYDNITVDKTDTADYAINPTSRYHGSAYAQITELTEYAGKTVTINMQIKGDNADAASNPRIVFENTAQTSGADILVDGVTDKWTKMSTWQDYSVTLTVPADGSVYVMPGSFAAGDDNWNAYINIVSIEEAA